jgi:hypothetical protein
MKIFHHSLFIVMLICTSYLTALSQANDSLKVVQFSGRVINTEENRIQKLMYVNIAVKGTPRGTVSDIDGFFSLAVREGESVLFSSIGFETRDYTIPTGISGNLYSKDIVMTKDTLFLPEAMIYPWPDKDFFKIEFLALEINNALQAIVEENLSAEKMEILREILPSDGGEVSKLELRQAAQAYYSYGQLKPQNIFNPLSWKKFIDAIKNGDFKKKSN